MHSRRQRLALEAAASYRIENKALEWHDPRFDPAGRTGKRDPGVRAARQPFAGDRDPRIQVTTRPSAGYHHAQTSLVGHLLRLVLVRLVFARLSFARFVLAPLAFARFVFAPLARSLAPSRFVFAPLALVRSVRL